MSTKETYHPSGLAATTEISKPKEVIVDPIKKIFIANRGEIAVRIIKACDELGISAVVTHHTSEKSSLATRMALKKMEENKDWDIVEINDYTDQDEILKKTIDNGCDAIALGYGFLSENGEFVKKCEKAGLKVLAPPSKVMEASLKDKITAKKTAKKFGIRVLDEIRDLSRLDYPVMLKIPNSGGGKGNFVVHDEKELFKAYGRINRLNPKAILVEPYIKNAAHVEIQIVADKYGNVVSLGERDCTMQRNYQKVIEESPSPHITEQMRNEMQEAAIKFAKEIGYQGLGTWEFIVDKDTKTWYFMEINPRIQVEHGVTEAQTGRDLVKLMIEIAEGEALSFSQENIKPQGYTMEVRLCAEELREAKDASKYIAACPGKISKIHFPKDKNVRVDTGVEDGDEMSPDFDSLIAKIIIHGKNRKEVRTKLIKYLKRITVEGIGCNKELLIDLLKSEELRNGEMTTTSIERFLNKARKGLGKGKEKLRNAKKELGERGVIFRKRRKKKHNGKKH